MKIKNALIAILAIVALSFQAQAQSIVNKDVIKELNKKVSKDYRKRAKDLSKRGWETVPGGAPMEKQLEIAAAKAYEMDEKGLPKNYVAYQIAKGETFAAAKMQAQQLALNDIANQIGSNIVGRIKSDVGNVESAADATSITEVISAYQNTVAAKLGRVMPVVMLMRNRATLKGSQRKKDNISKTDKFVEVQCTMLYDMAAAEKMIKQDLRKELKKKTSMLHDEIDELIGL